MLGQDQRFTLILQTLQQLKDVYGDSVDKVIQGNAQPLTSFIATPSGFVKMGDMKLGDKIITPRDGVQVIDGIFPKGVRDVYKIRLKDGSVARACGEHLWKVIVRKKSAV